MALIPLATAQAASSASVSGCTYINTLISGATGMGLNYTRVDNQYMNTSILNALIIAGYQVSNVNNDMLGTYQSYIISW